jgi:hypothetical protein
VHRVPGWALRDSNPRPAGCKADQDRGSLGQFIAVRCIVPAHSGCRVGAVATSATDDDALTPNCWDACWDEMGHSGIENHIPFIATRRGLGRVRTVEKNITLVISHFSASAQTRLIAPLHKLDPSPRENGGLETE